MRNGDMVVFSIGHYDWLNQAGRWPMHKTRDEVTGTVMGVSGDIVVVTWWGTGKTFSHLAENLELVGVSP